jgi:Fe-S cluster assembly iron-binding protein IscA|tara:strand:+ start:134 stop:442 length:309 start_codon:yes stop_codon:yes gene_type:complete
VLNITLKAKEKLNQISAEKNIWPLQFLRLTIPPIWSGEGDFGIVIDNANEDDIQINFENKTILLIESSINESLSNSTLDYIESGKQIGFNLDIYPADNNISN